MLIDEDQTLYYSYSMGELGFNSAPYPLQVVIDRDGLISYLALEYDVDAVRAAIEAALAE